MERSYERDYVRDRLLVGLVHQRVGVDLEWYLGAYRFYLSEMLRTLLGDNEQHRLYDSLLKIVFFDMISPSTPTAPLSGTPWRTARRG